MVDEEKLQELRLRFCDAVFISALKQEGFSELFQKISQRASMQEEIVHLLLPFDKAALLDRMYEQSRLIHQEVCEEGYRITVALSKDQRSYFEEFEY